MKRLVPILICLIIITTTLSNPVYGWSTLQVGVLADSSSKGNTGMSVAVRTNVYHMQENELDYFWISTDLSNGAFVQFGYSLEPGTYCLRGEAIGGNPICHSDWITIGPSDARWQWQYWPNKYGINFYWGIGPANSVGPNGTWRVYSIVANKTSWSFQLDGKVVDSLSFRPVPSNTPVKFVAEKGFSSQQFSNRLGPVQFRNMSYLKEDGWHSVKSLTALVDCAPHCNLSNPFGIAVYGPGGYMIAGSGIKRPVSGEVLWNG